MIFIIRFIKLKIDANYSMTFLSYKIILYISLLILIIAACNDAGKNDKAHGIKDNDTISTKQENSFLFLTEWFDKVGVYKYDLAKKKYSTVWWHPRENVVMLVYKPGSNPAYFLTSEKMGMKANFPFFNRLKLFIISHDLVRNKAD